MDVPLITNNNGIWSYAEKKTAIIAVKIARLVGLWVAQVLQHELHHLAVFPCEPSFTSLPLSSSSPSDTSICRSSHSHRTTTRLAMYSNASDTLAPVFADAKSRCGPMSGRMTWLEVGEGGAGVDAVVSGGVDDSTDSVVTFVLIVLLDRCSGERERAGVMVVPDDDDERIWRARVGDDGEGVERGVVNCCIVDADGEAPGSGEIAGETELRGVENKDEDGVWYMESVVRVVVIVPCRTKCESSMS